MEFPKADRKTALQAVKVAELRSVQDQMRQNGTSLGSITFPITINDRQLSLIGDTYPISEEAEKSASMKNEPHDQPERNWSSTFIDSIDKGLIDGTGISNDGWAQFRGNIGEYNAATRASYAIFIKRHPDADVLPANREFLTEIGLLEANEKAK